jgi:hypothetical protein
MKDLRESPELIAIVMWKAPRIGWMERDRGNGRVRRTGTDSREKSGAREKSGDDGEEGPSDRRPVGRYGGIGDRTTVQ